MAMEQSELKTFDEFVEEEMEDAGQSDQFKIMDEQSADWALRKIQQVERERKRLSEWVKGEIEKFKAEIEKYETYMEEQDEGFDRDREFFEGLLAEYGVRIGLDQRERKKTIKTPNGSFGFRKARAKWEFQDAEVVKALEEKGLADYIRVKKSPDKVSIKKSFQVKNGKVYTPDGEHLEGVAVIEQGQTFSVKVVE